MKKLVLISGSGRGLGSSIARSFISSGYRVAINYMKSEEQAHNLSNELGENALAFKADISDKSQVISMLNDIEDSFNDSPSILVNNAMTDYVFNGNQNYPYKTFQKTSPINFYGKSVILN